MNEYFLVQNYGYDGLDISRFPNLTGAQTAYKEALRDQEDWDKRYPNHPSNKGLLLIKGTVVAEDHPEELF